MAHVGAGRLLGKGDNRRGALESAAYEAAQRRLFFVGCTRAMRHLYVTYNREVPSPFLAGLSKERWERVESAVG